MPKRPKSETRRYIVDECASDVAALQNMLDDMSGRGWTVVSKMWLPKRPSAQRDDEFDNAQYVVVFDREIADAPVGEGMKEDEIDAEHEATAKIRKKYGFGDPPPDTWRGDEARIAKRYGMSLWNLVAAPLIMIPSAIYLDLKYVVAIGFALIAAAIWSADARAYDLAIRLRRATTLLQEIRDRQYSN